ncbi:MAG: helix-turn-helix transcriptional regulator [Candidatus Omnitrophota bacterium]
MKRKKVKTYLDTLMADKEFRERFEEEYQNLSISEQIVMARKAAHLTQAALAKRVHTTKSAVSRYESADYNKYSISLLNRIAHACKTNLRVLLIPLK